MNGSTTSRRPSLEEKILSHLRSNNNQNPEATRKEIQKKLVTKDVTSSSSDVTKKDIKRSLKRLVKRGDIVKDGKKYKIIPPAALDDYDSDDGSRNNDSSSLDDDERDDEAPAVAPFVPIAERIRQTAQTERSDDNLNVKQTMDLDEEIRRLEAELADSDDDDDDEESDYDDSSDDTSIDGNKASTSQADGIICLSSVADERIVPLPQGALPQNKRRALKNIDAGDGEPKKSKKRKSSSSTPKEEHAISEGLKDA
eukprot:scaffold36215_cov139-Skeletonema_dohrnii-CCMP3373.AAC.1